MNVLIAGLPRTGTTALVRLLNQAEGVIVTNELGQFSPDKWRDHEKFASRLQSLRDARGPRFDVDFGGQGRSFEEEFRRICERRWGGCGYIRWLSEKYPIVGDKHTEYVRQLAKVLEHDPGLKVILTLRDGRASIASSVRNWHTLQSRPHWVKPSFLEAEEYWLSSVRPLLTAMQTKPDALVVRYEESCNDPRRLVEELSSFLSFPLQIEDPSKTYRPTNLDTWKEESAGHVWCQETRVILEQLNYFP